MLFIRPVTKLSLVVENKLIRLLWWHHQFLCLFTVNGYFLLCVSRQSRLSDERADRIKPRTMLIYSGKYLSDEENPGKPQLTGPLPSNEVRTARHGKEIGKEEGRKSQRESFYVPAFNK